MIVLYFLKTEKFNIKSVTVTSRANFDSNVGSHYLPSTSDAVLCSSFHHAVVFNSCPPFDVTYPCASWSSFSIMTYQYCSTYFPSRIFCACSEQAPLITCLAYWVFWLFLSSKCSPFSVALSHFRFCLSN